MVENNGKIETQIPITDKDSQEIIVDIVMEGKSAYDMAVEKGFDGTLEEWLLSLHGKDADVDGIQAQFDTVEERLDSTDAQLNNMTQDFNAQLAEKATNINNLQTEVTEFKEDYAEQRVLDLQEIESKRQQDQLKVAKVEKDINDYQSTMANVNVNQEAKQNVSGYGVVSLPKNSANGHASASVKGSTLTNNVKNGDFRNGTEGWSGAIGVTTSSIDNTLILTGTGLVPKPRLVTANGEGISSNSKVFVRARVRVTNSECINLTARLRYENGGAGAFISVDNPIEGEWYESCRIAEFSFVTAGLWFEHVYSDAATSDGKSMEVKDVIQIDLSQNPELANLSADEINELIPNYFEGTKSTISASRLKSVGKNLFDYNSTTIYKDMNAPKLNFGEFAFYKTHTYTTNNFSHKEGVYEYTGIDLGRYGYKLIYRGSPNTTYNLYYFGETISGTVADIVQGWNTKIIETSADGIGEVTVFTARYTTSKVVFSKVMVTKIPIQNLDNSYEPYTESTQYLPNVGELRSLPNGVRDEIRIQ